MKREGRIEVLAPRSRILYSLLLILLLVGVVPLSLNAYHLIKRNEEEQIGYVKELQNEMLSNVAEILMLRGDYANAAAHYRAAIEAFPQGPYGHYGLATLLNVMGRGEEALDEAITAWDLDRGGLAIRHEFFLDEEWRWQRDAFLAEADGRWDDALSSWQAVVAGSVKRLVLPARAHVRRIEALLGED